MSDVYLHVGPIKTGSTYLQDLIWTNRRDLASQGVLHPAEHDNELWFAANDVQDGAFIHFDMPEAAGAWERVCDRVIDFAGPSIISHEVLGLSTDDHVARIAESLTPATLHIVVMARSLAATLPSTWQEKVKMVDPDVSWPDFLGSERESRSPWTDAALIVQRWLRFVPASQIHVITVPPRGTARETLLNRFAEAVGIDVSSWTSRLGAANESLDAVQVELLRRLNLATSNVFDRRGQRRLVNGALLPHIRRGDPTRRLRLPSSERDWIEAETSRRIRGLQESKAIIHGDLEELNAPPDCWSGEISPVTESDLLNEALMLLASSHPDSVPDRRDI